LSKPMNDTQYTMWKYLKVRCWQKNSTIPTLDELMGALDISKSCAHNNYKWLKDNNYIREKVVVFTCEKIVVKGNTKVNTRR